VSPAGDAFETLPPIVPALRIWSLAKWSQASTSTGRCLRTSGSFMICVIVASAPMRIASPSRAMPFSASMRRMFSSVAPIRLRPIRACTIRSVPPARIVASSESRSASSASCSVAGAR